jgi:septum formation protein
VTRLLLASASPARRATLTSAGITPLVRVSGVDEDAVLAAAADRFGDLEPADAVLVLAQAKAEAVAHALRADPTGDADLDELDDLDDVLVLGCDSMLEIDGEIHGKPADAAQATARWHAMRGRSGTLHTGHWLIDEREPATGGTGGTLGATSSTVVHFADLSDAEIDAYVATGEPLAVAGAFTVDGLGGAFVTGLEGDYHGVVGVSLPLLRELLAQVGVTVPDLWSLSTGDNAG